MVNASSVKMNARLETAFYTTWWNTCVLGFPENTLARIRESTNPRTVASLRVECNSAVGNVIKQIMWTGLSEI